MSRAHLNWLFAVKTLLRTPLVRVHNPGEGIGQNGHPFITILENFEGII